MFTMGNAAFNACWDTTYARRHWTKPLMPGSNWAMSTSKQKQFFHKRFNQQQLYFYSHIRSAIDLQCHVFPFEKLFLMFVFVCKRHFWRRQIWRHLHVTTLQCWTKFSNGLVHWSVRMIHAKKHETVPKFVKVMPRILWRLFFRTRCI